MQTHILEPDRRVMEWLLTGRWEFSAPKMIVAGLSAEDACRVMDGQPYTIAGIIAHIDWWQRLRISLAQGGRFPAITPGIDDWPEVDEAGWSQLVEDFLAGLDEMLALVEAGPDLKAFMIDDLSMGTVLVSHACHNAYHLGQVVLMRRLQGTWPPDGV